MLLQEKESHEARLIKFNDWLNIAATHAELSYTPSKKPIEPAQETCKLLDEEDLIKCVKEL